MASKWGAAGEGALEYGLGGAGAGSIFGPMGAAIGGGLGLLAGGLKGYLSGGKKKSSIANPDQFVTKTPEQMELLKQRAGELGPDSYLAKLAAGDQSQFAELEAPAYQQFNEFQGALASRFSGPEFGTGARKSSGFQNASTTAASQFAQQLQANRMSIRGQALQGLHEMSNQLLGQSPYQQYQGQNPQSNYGFFGNIMQQVTPQLGKFAGERLTDYARGNWTPKPQQQQSISQAYPTTLEQYKQMSYGG